MSLFMISAALVIAAFSFLGSTSSGKVRNSGDYVVANRQAGAMSVSGVIMGALVAGGSTIGTVQLAYKVGVSAWWFTLGSGIGCAILGLRFAGPVRASGLSTLPEFIERNYGYPTALLTLIGSTLGTLLSVVAQFLAGTALLCSVFPLSQGLATFILSLTILGFIYMGGLKSFSVVGNAKTVVLYLLLALCCLEVFSAGETPSAIARNLPFFPWFDPFGRGFAKDLGACVSLIAGIFCTQIYMQAIFAASDESTAKRGCLIASALIPPLGLMAVWVGLAMRHAEIFVEPAQALPYFIRTTFHPAVGGALWAGLAITVIGGASGLCLGVAANLSIDIGARVTGMERSDKRLLAMNRLAVLFSVAAAAILSLSMKGQPILQLSYLAMGLRAAGMIVPMLVAILRPGTLSRRDAFASSLAGLATMLLVWLFVPAVEPLFAGLLLSGAAAFLLQRKRQKIRKV